MEFVLNERLAKGGFEVTRKYGCRILLKNEANFAWFILVPVVAEGTEDLHQLDEETFANVMAGVREVSRFVESHFKPEKLNVGCIGNMVRQMHIHVVGRFTNDPAWPGVVWACDEKRKYGEGEAKAIVLAAQDFLSG
ncbi:MAG: HIT family protein [Akkermansiaceae bacterium]|jgi:diadenosine tetraphosphate (Ap4A) HIT family hydrolase|nr:HIT family protein [Akkermansiaceae bacterium]MDP4646957.1 HIT family protein [Akkermansiaceae bacterium]MDP4720620.1 HIT family protein [Akkermansiaceae bacterium]MDP4780188.1 HIT family protein [Akkermansiaceae bacterium]MDP4897974.1 HIT family protein [Akkermansiaceae bacterium]